MPRSKAPFEASTVNLDEVEAAVLAVQVKGGKWLAFKPARVLSKLPGHSDDEKAIVAGRLLLERPAVRAQWTFIAGIAGLTVCREAVIALLSTLDPERMFAGPDPEVAPLWHDCLHQVVMRAFAGDSALLLSVGVVKRLKPGLLAARGWLGDPLSDDERDLLRNNLGRSATPGMGHHPGEVLVWSTTAGLHLLPWKTARSLLLP